jgi:hypothetical protein
MDGPAGAGSPIRALWIPQIDERPVRSATEVLADAPVLAERLLRYRGELDQVGTVVGRLRSEVGRATRDRSNSLVLSPRDPRTDRDGEATPLLCLQLRRQLDRLHAAAAIVGRVTPELVTTILDLQRTIAAAAAIPPGGAALIQLSRPT